MSTNGINEAFKAGFSVKLQNRGAKSSGITFELKSVFDEMAKAGLIKDTDGKGLTKKEALEMFNALNKIHQQKQMSTNFGTMQIGQEFNYTADDLKALAQAAGYEVVEPKVEDAKPQLDEIKPTVPDFEDTKILDVPEKLEVPQDITKQNTEQLLDDVDAKVLTREVNGEKTKIAIVKDENGNKVRRQINEDGTLGDTLVPVSTVGKNKYITQTEMDNRIKNVFPEGLPDGVDAKYVTIGGEPVLIFKKDGKTLDQSQLRELVKSQNKEATSEHKNEHVTGPKEGENPQYDAIVKGENPVATPEQSVDVKGEAPVETPKKDNVSGVQNKLSEAQVQEFMQKDGRIINLMNSLPELKQEAEDLTAKHDAAMKNFDFETVSSMGVSHFEAEMDYKSAQRAVRGYQNTLQNWEEGALFRFKLNNVDLGVFTQTTLPDGRKGYMKEVTDSNGQKFKEYFEIGINTELGTAGFPGDLVAKVPVE